MASTPILWTADGPATAVLLQDEDRRVWRLSTEQVAELLYLVQAAASGAQIRYRAGDLVDEVRQQPTVEGAR